MFTPITVLAELFDNVIHIHFYTNSYSVLLDIMSANDDAVLGEVPDGEERESNEESQRAPEVGDEGHEGVGVELPADSGAHRTKAEPQAVVTHGLLAQGSNLVFSTVQLYRHAHTHI